VIVMDKYVAYYRVSTTKQGESGLGLEAQRRMVETYIDSKGVLTNEFTEVETGTSKKKRPILQQAVELCIATESKLVIAKIDRLARDVHFVSSLSKSGVDFICCDMPDANKFTIHIMAAMAENEAQMISDRTKAALKSIKDKIDCDGFYVTKSGNKIYRLGGDGVFPESAINNSIATRKKMSDMNLNKKYARPYAVELRRQGMKLQDIADKLNENGYLSASGGKYHKTSVNRLINKT
jgi:hypothetical protein